MKRREFLRASAYSSAVLGGSSVGTSLLFPSSSLASPGFGAGNGRVLVNVMMLGGADLRHLFVPPPGTDYGAVFWAARETIFNISGASNWDPMVSYANGFDEITVDGETFGINKNAGWLKQQILDGNVAIVCNVVGSQNQRHDHSQLIMNSGYPGIQNYDFNTSGWGGRLAQTMGNANVVSMANSISLFAYGDDAINRNLQVISAPDTRNIALLEPGDGAISSADQNAIARSLKSYYFKKNDIDLEGTPYLKILQHERAIRDFGRNVQGILSQTGNAQSQALQDLITGSTSVTKLNDIKFARQCSGIYDSFLVNEANPTTMGFRVASLEYNGWDTHKNLDNKVGQNLDDIFGLNRSLHTLTTALENRFGTGISDDTAYVFTSDFGRQIASNGTNGTDHGKGTYMMVMSNSVRGGVYGEMFPQSEVTPNFNGDIQFDKNGAFIVGRTSYERVLGELCDWVQPGSGATVFAGRFSASEEAGANLYTLFSKNLFDISGNVTSALGNGLASATVVITSTFDSNIRWTVTTDQNGVFSTGAVAINGTYDIAASKSGYQFSATTLTVNGADTSIDFSGIAAAFTGTVSGRITTPDGRGIAGLTFWDVSKYPSTVTTDNDGYYVIEDYIGGESVWLNLNGAINGKYTYQAAGWNGGAFVHNGSAEVARNFILTPVQGSISGRIVDEFGDGIAGLTFWDITKYPETVTTDSDGYYMITGYTSGNSIYFNMYSAISNQYTFRASGWNGGSITHDGTAMTGFDFVFTKSLNTISGRITTPDGKGVSGLTFWDVSRYPATVTTDANGYYMIGGYSVGDAVYFNMNSISDYTVSASGWSGGFFNHDGSSMMRNFIVNPKTNSEFIGTVSGRITTPDGRGIAGITFWDVSKYPSKVTTDNDGYYIIEGYSGGETVWMNLYSATTGKYTFQAAGWSGNNFIHNGGAEVARDFIFTSLQGSISGRIVDEFGDGIAGLTFWDVSKYPDTVTTDSDGYYMINGYNGGETIWLNLFTATGGSTGGSYSSVADGWGGGTIIHDGTAMSGFDYIFTRKQGTISGRITTPDGKGVGGLTFWDVSRYPVTVTTDANGYYMIGGYKVGDGVYFNMNSIADYSVTASGWTGTFFNHDGLKMIRDFIVTLK